MENGTLFISEVWLEDANNYGCTAGSSAGLNRREIQLIVQGNKIDVIRRDFKIFHISFLVINFISKKFVYTQKSRKSSRF